MRKWGVLLIPLLSSEEERVFYFERELKSPKGLIVELSQVAWMMPLPELNPHLDFILKNHGESFIYGLTKKLRQREIEKDARYRQLVLLYQKALAFAGTSQSAKENLIFLKSNVRADIEGRKLRCQELFIEVDFR